MTAMAQPLSGIDASHADAMDLLSDTGYSGGEAYAVDDGDIEIDFGADDGDVHVADDAISLQDATIEGDVEHQAAPADADDDFMVDKDDLIEEDEIEYDDLELEDADRPSVDGQHEATGHLNLTPGANNNEEVVEEDLIDYSDDEDQQPDVVPSIGSNGQDVQEGNDVAGTVAEVDFSAESAPAATEASVHNGGDDTVYEQPGEDHEQEFDAPKQTFDGNEPANREEQTNSQHQQISQARPDGNLDDQQPDAVHQEQGKADSIHQSKEDVEARQASEHPPELPVQQAAEFEANNEEPDNAQGDGASRMHPVTVNYDGAELWLFKTDDSGDDDWLLEDESIVSQPFYYLFHACRAQLGDDLNSETELGIRFDNFRGLELFEDCTACACTTLKEFVDIYTTLHAQDGQTDPEPLYVTLQFRPRFSTLVNELKMAVQGQIGFAGLENAIAAGQTSFSNMLHPASDVFEEQWDNEGEDGAGAGEGNEQESGDDNAFHPEERSEEAHVGPAQGHSAATSPVVESAVGDTDQTAESEPKNPDATVASGDGEENASTTGSHTGQEAQDDFIDYTDDEDEEDAAQAGKTPPQEASSASSTVQGDEPSYDQSAAHEHTNEIKRHDGDSQSNSGDAEEEEAYPYTPTGVVVEQEADYAEYTQDAASNYPEDAADDGYTEAYGAGDFDSADYSGQTLGQESHNDYYGIDGNTDLGQQNDPSLINEAEDSNELGTYEDTVVHTEEAYEGANDFAELVAEEIFNDGPSGDLNDEIEDEIDYDDEEDAPGQDTTTAVSVSVPSPITSSRGLDDQGSPQGQKRPHDEIDGGLDGASDTTDSKRPKL